MRGLVGAAVGGEGAGLDEEFFGEVEGGEVAVAEGPEAEGDAAGAAAGFEERSVAVGEGALDEDAFGLPESEIVGGARVMQDGGEIVEVGADGAGGDFGFLGGGQRGGRSWSLGFGVWSFAGGWVSGFEFWVENSGVGAGGGLGRERAAACGAVVFWIRISVCARRR